MMPFAFAESALPARVVVLRLLLQPYALGHEVILQARGNPLVCLSRAEFDALPRQKQIAALILAVLVCYKDWESNQKPERWLRLWSWLNRRADYVLAVAEFRTYLEDGRKVLPVLDPDKAEDLEAYEIANKGKKMDTGRGLGSPLVSGLINFGLNSLRLSYRETMDMPFGLVTNLYYSSLESKGALAIENHQEAEARATMAGHRADLRTEKGAAAAAWEACVTDEDRAAAFAKHPKIETLFAEAWNACHNAMDQYLVCQRFPVVAPAVLAKSGVPMPTQPMEATS